MKIRRKIGIGIVTLLAIVLIACPSVLMGLIISENTELPFRLTLFFFPIGFALLAGLLKVLMWCFDKEKNL